MPGIRAVNDRSAAARFTFTLPLRREG